MKPKLIHVLSIVCAVAVLLTVQCISYAAPSVNNSIKGQENPGSVPGDYRNGLEAILATGDGNAIVLPDSKSYFPTLNYLYISAPKNNSVYVYRDLTANPNQTMPTAYQGSRVLALAEQDGFTCVIYHDLDNKAHAGWVNSDHLSYVFPGKESSVGRNISSVALQNAGDPELEWSRDNFIGEKQKYTLLEEPIQNCVQFTLDYQVTARNGAQTNQILGPRTVYVNDGSGWVEVGTFDYADLGAMHISVYLPAPMTLAAVATSATCAKPDVFSFRQSVLDPMV